ncbi:Transmembrane protein 54 [Anabarilius grahami]|uniref:Transmembrane protein 54 n=1 Tax=Anabarilius grahami TaxID=495550 RepID=A0A3N0XX57_ANAGA|nr:Transmembrane protein 54 [Anabarilius grahami]
MHAGEQEEGRPSERHGLCCGSLKDDKILMKMGLGLVLVGHVNFLLGALVHGVVLRHIKVFTWNRKLVYPISNVIALVAGLMAIIGGISAIVLSKNKKNQLLSWFLLIVSVLGCLLGAASAVAISVATGRAIHQEGYTLFTHCNLSNNMSYYSITNECPFDPTRIYVRVQLPEETALPPEDDSNEEEPAEQHDLLDKDTVAVETSDWL